MQPTNISQSSVPIRGKQHRGKCRNTGMAVVTLMLVLMVIMAVTLVGVIAGGSSANSSKTNSGGLVSATNGGLGAVRTRMRMLGALNLADSGTEIAMQWLSQQPSPPTNNSAFAPWPAWDATKNNNFTDFALNGGRVRIRMYPYANNTGPSLKSYVIESIGEYLSARQIIRTVAVQDTFAKYAFFTDNASDNWWVAGNTQFNGPVHINASNGKKINILWKSGGNTSNRIFTYDGTDAFSTSADSINWNKNSVSPPSTVINPTTSTDWKGVAAGGEPTIRTKVAPVPLPTASTIQKNAALGTTTAEPGGADPFGVMVPNSGSVTNGGIYIHGDVDSMELGASSGANSGSWWTKQSITVIQTNASNTTEKRTIIEIDPTVGASGQTKMLVYSRAKGSSNWGSATTTTYTGKTNGVVYSDGHIGKQGNSTTAKSGGLSGTVADTWTSDMPGAATGDARHLNKLNIVTDASKNLNINGNIKYAPGTNAPNSPILGIVSKQVQVVDKDKNNSNIKNIEVHASVVAYDTFDVTNPTTREKGTFTLTGGYIAANAGQFGTVDASTGALVTGFKRILNYDKRMAETPPPYFPSTANQYIIQSSQRVATTLE